MGVKSTIQLTRQEAEERFRIMVIKAYGDDWIAGLPDNVLEEQLTFVDDHMHGGESFNNYSIVPDWLISDPKDDR